MKNNIIKNTINILNGLYNNIDVYEVRVDKGIYCKHPTEDFRFIIYYRYNDTLFQLTINNSGYIRFSTGGPNLSQIDTEVDDSKKLYEIIYLTEKLYDKSKEVALSKMTEFANIFEKDDI